VATTVVQPTDSERLTRARERIVDEMDGLIDEAAEHGMTWAVDSFQRYAELRERLALIDERMA
jgi:hypothetical protein